MMSVKLGTQTWSKADQQTSYKPDIEKNLSASEQSMLGDQPVGDYLNKVADPNWVDPSKLRRVGNSDLNKDAFLKLLLAQMKNQDPTNPMKSHEMAAQLAQFSSLEQLTNIDTSIKDLAKGQEPQQKFETLNLIGKSVFGDSSQILRTKEDESHEIRFQLANDAAKAQLKIKDANGEVVKILDLSNLQKGINEIGWTGQNEEGRMAQRGEYTVEIAAFSSNGTRVFAETKFEGRISGVKFTPQGPQIMIGNQVIRLSDISMVKDNSMEQNAAMAAAIPGMVPANSTQAIPAASGMVHQPKLKSAPTTEVKPDAKSGTIPKYSNLDQVGMNRDLVNKLSKELKGGS